MSPIPSQEQINAAAKTLSKHRSVEQQAIVDAAKKAGNTTAKNLDHAADRAQRFGGK